MAIASAQIGRTVGVLETEAPAETFVVVGASDAGAALAEVSDSSYVKLTGQYRAGDPAPVLRVTINELKRPHLAATDLSIRLRLNMSTGSFSRLPSVQLVDRATHATHPLRMRSVDRAYTLRTDLIGNDFEDVVAYLPAQLLRGHQRLDGSVDGIYDFGDLALDITSPEGVGELLVSNATVQAGGLYPSAGLPATFIIRKITGENYAIDNVFGWHAGVMAGATVTYTTTYSGAPLDPNNVVADCIRRAGWAVAPDEDVVIEFQGGQQHFFSGLTLQGTNLNSAAYWRVNGQFGSNGAFRKIDKLWLRSEDPTDAGRAEIGELRHWLTISSNQQVFDIGHVGYEHIRFYKKVFTNQSGGTFTSRAVIETPFDQWGRHILGVYDCHMTGDITNSGDEFKFGMRIGYHPLDVLDCKFGGRIEEHLTYVGSPQGDSQLCRNLNMPSTDFYAAHPSYSGPGSAGDPWIKSSAYQVVQRADECTGGSGGGPPGFGTSLYEDNTADRGINPPTAFTFSGYTNGVVIARRCHATRIQNGGAVLQQSDCVKGLNSLTTKGNHLHIGQFDGPAEIYPCAGTPRPSVYPMTGSIWETEELILDEFDFDTSASVVPIRIAACKRWRIIGIGPAGWVSTKSQKVWEYPWGLVFGVGQWTSSGAGAWASLAGEFEVPAGQTITDYYGFGRDLFSFGSPDNPFKPAGNSSTEARATLEQINALVPDNGTVGHANYNPDTWPPWQQRGDFPSLGNPAGGQGWEGGYIFPNMSPPVYYQGAPPEAIPTAGKTIFAPGRNTFIGVQEAFQLSGNVSLDLGPAPIALLVDPITWGSRIGRADVNPGFPPLVPNRMVWGVTLAAPEFTIGLGLHAQKRGITVGFDFSDAVTLVQTFQLTPDEVDTSTTFNSPSILLAASLELMNVDAVREAFEFAAPTLTAGFVLHGQQRGIEQGTTLGTASLQFTALPVDLVAPPITMAGGPNAITPLILIESAPQAAPTLTGDAEFDRNLTLDLGVQRALTADANVEGL